jgi:mono/diheme cytochrome c family protein
MIAECMGPRGTSSPTDSAAAPGAQAAPDPLAMTGIRLALLCSVVLPLCLAGCSDAVPNTGRAAGDAVSTGAAGDSVDLVARGRYLTEGLLRCFICHSERSWEGPGAPPVAGRQGAGFVWRDDGSHRLVAPNLTPDAETGIGRWTDAQLARAIREGIGHDGRRLHRAMPSFNRLADSQVAAVIAHLRSRAPIHNPLPQTALSDKERDGIEANPRRALKPLSPSTDPVERGRDLVILGECTGCHTSWHSPRMPGLLGGGNLIQNTERQAFSTNLTAHASGLAYDADAFIQVMRSGKGNTLSPLMPWIVYRSLSDDDLRVMHAFLRTMHPVAHYVGNSGTPTHCPVCGQQHPLGELNHLPEITGIELDPRVYDDYVGRYQSQEYGFVVTITRAGDRLLAQWDDLPQTELIPQSETRFLEAGGVAPLRFVRGADGQVTKLISEEVEELVLDRVS